MSKRLLLSSGIIIVSLAFNATAFASEGVYKTRSSQTRTPAVIGTVSSINGSSVTLNTRKGAIYVIDTSKAKITKSDSQIKTSDILNGDTLIVVGKVDNNTVSATKIIDGVVNSVNFKANYFTGKINSINGTSFTIQSNGKKKAITETVKSDDNTVFTKDGQAASLSDLNSGQIVIITGTKDGNVINAASISIGVNKAGTRVIGTVETVSNSVISVKDNTGTTYTVNITKAKIINDNKAVQVGEKIVVFGSQTSGTTNITATVIREHC